jgi:uncharacterized protein
MSKENTLPAKVTDPFRFAENAIHLQGTLLVKNMERLCTGLSSDSGEVDISMVFGVDEQKISFIRGHYATHLTLQCQRCMELFDQQLAGDFLLGIVRSEEEAGTLPERYNPVIVANDNSLIIQEIIEDELIISLPIVPMHNASECNVRLPLSSSSKDLGEIEKQNPFKVIEFLRKKQNSTK